MRIKGQATREDALTLALSGSTRLTAGRNTGRGNRKAFTLIELLLVLVILTVLAGLIVPQFTNQSKKAKTTAAKTDISNISTALDAFEIDAGRYPTNDEGLNALVQQPSGVTEWHGPYLKQIKNDPWGTPYIYRSPGQHNTSSYDLYSAGPDLHDGDDDDVTNWN